MSGGHWVAPGRCLFPEMCQRLENLCSQPPFTSTADPSSRGSPPATLASQGAVSVGVEGSPVFCHPRPVVGLWEQGAQLSTGRCLVLIWEPEGSCGLRCYHRRIWVWAGTASFPPGSTSPARSAQAAGPRPSRELGAPLRACTWRPEPRSPLSHTGMKWVKGHLRAEEGGWTAWWLKIRRCCNVPAVHGPHVCVLGSHWRCGQAGPRVTDTRGEGRHPWALTCSPGCPATSCHLIFTAT